MDLAAQLLHSVRVGVGATQRDFAARAQVAQPRIAEIERASVDPRVATLDRLLRAGGSQVTVIPTVAATAAASAAAIRDDLTAHAGRRGEDRAFRRLLSFSDGLASAAPDVRVSLCVAPPVPTSDARFDAALAGLAEHHLSDGGLPLPAWVAESGRILDPPWIVDPFAGPHLLEEVPGPLRRRGVLLSAHELESV